MKEQIFPLINNKVAQCRLIRSSNFPELFYKILLGVSRTKHGP